MIVRYLLLALAVGCATSEPDAIDEVVGRPSAATIAPCPAGQWCIEVAPTDGTAIVSLLRGVWAISADDVFAVGDGGTILRRTNNAWTVLPSGTTSSLHAVWAASSSDAWAAGAGGIILHFDGTSWSPISGATTSDIDAVWGSGATDVWFAGSGVVTHWNGTVISTSLFTSGFLESISGTGPKDVWIVGESTFLHHFTGSWATIKSTKTSTMSAVLALGANELWVTDNLTDKETMHSTNGAATWTPQTTGGAVFSGLAASAPNDVWGAGGTRVGNWNGSAWAVAQPFGSSVALTSITLAARNVWTVGANGLIAHLVF